MHLVWVDPPRRDTSAYRAWKAAIRRERPICEHCNSAPSRIIAHKRQPVLGGGLMDKSNVLALCVECDRTYTALNPVIRRRPGKRKNPCQKPSPP